MSDVQVEVEVGSTNWIGLHHRVRIDIMMDVKMEFDIIHFQTFSRKWHVHASM